LAEHASAIDPLSEVAARAAILARTLLGDRSAALAEAGAFADRIRTELGVEPDSETMRLLRQLVTLAQPQPQPPREAPPSRYLWWEEASNLAA
ncbi:MAG TPA: BTAD domain-containing putative transcriptional regulator, partial [Gemmatimonadales bacterium]|nr:BTAD domain-containing putative transcriptional regulator [Gemmatimonadales bacterium]